jgi:hypothetical protein
MKMLFGVHSPTLYSLPQLLTQFLSGVAYTIDPAYEAEVRDYLGQAMSLHPQPRVR